MRKAELEAAMGEPGFWDDQSGAARISREHARVSRQLDTYERLSREYGDARELLELEPDHLPALDLMGFVCFSLRDYEAAEGYNRRALARELGPLHG